MTDDNQQRAADVLGSVMWAGITSPVAQGVIAAALDEAEARGRAEVAARVETGEPRRRWWRTDGWDWLQWVGLLLIAFAVGLAGGKGWLA